MKNKYLVYALGFLIPVVAIAQTVTPGGGSSNGAQKAVLTSDFTESAAAMTNTALSLNVAANVSYQIDATILMSEAVFGDGAKVDFNGGTATATTFLVSCTLSNGTVGSAVAQTSSHQNSLAGGSNIASLTNGSTHLYKCTGFFKPATSGTLVFRAAQNAHTTGTLSILAGSFMILTAF